MIITNYYILFPTLRALHSSSVEVPLWGPHPRGRNRVGPRRGKLGMK